MQREKAIGGRACEVLNIIGELTVEDVMITSSRITARTDMIRQNVRQQVLKLESLDLIEPETDEVGRMMIIRLRPVGYAELGMTPATESTGLPILGEVAAGQPTCTSDQAPGHAGHLQHLFRVRPGDFLLRVRGDSMIGIGIQPSDLVVIRASHEEPQPGTITLVCIPGEDTAILKRWHRKGRCVTLTSENLDCSPLTFDVESVQMQGYFLHCIATRS
ncbi:LexA family protein [Deinococcus sp. Marseille-Q6407]|uniref:LexA family protein n=1 Tax=Deinococcus sp. Marseille-Q6407 TaxID=2969223 RepID=UPI0021C023F2|nr:S24 family peptidase [Deinococcus sp. Marseille-Q6407]